MTLKIFITIPWFLPAFKAGGPIQSISNLVNNYHEGFHYYIFCSNEDLNGEELVRIETDKWVSFNEHVDVWYASEDISKNLTQQTEIIKPDVLFIIGIFSWQYNMVPLFFSKAPVKILSVRGMLHAGALAQKRLKKQVYLRALKLTGIHKKIVFHATDEEEQQFIRAAFGEQVKIKIANNFGRKLNVSPRLSKQEGSLKLVTIALISPMKNHLKVLEALARCRDHIEYNIYGPIKDASYWELCRQQIIAMPKNVQVNYHGEISPDIVPVALAQNHVFIMPSESENFGHAIYEALSAGKPVITGHCTPWNGLENAGAGINADLNAEAIGKAIGFYAEMNEGSYAGSVNAAQAYIAARTNEEAIHLQYKQLFALQ